MPYPLRGMWTKKKPGQRGPGGGASHDVTGSETPKGRMCRTHRSAPGGNTGTLTGGDVKEGPTYWSAHAKRMMPCDMRMRSTRDNI